MMLHGKTPWLGLVALAAMFILPYLPAWLFEGPRTVRHRPRRHVCADCGATWTDDHRCATEGEPVKEVLRGELVRGKTPRDLVLRPPPRPSEYDY
jgi:hypothetical protein